MVVAITVLGIIRGLGLLSDESSARRRRGLLYLVASVLLPLCCWIGPSQVVRLEYGNYPIGEDSQKDRIREGMTMDEVTSMLGTPHERHSEAGKELWFYWMDAYSIFWFAVDFGPDGRVTKTYGN
jgi:outer membrane protein assembly factor BamE (lipoprotein component of BamABCDE complex)